MKTILITGATDGIGLETAQILAGLGHNLVIHGRNADKLKKTHKLLLEIAPNIEIDTYKADLSDFYQVAQLVDNIKKCHQPLDIIINNAGVFKTDKPVSGVGVDVRFVVNTISPFIITKGLLPVLKDNGRIINLSSAAQAPVNLEAMRGSLTIADDFQAYAQSKLAITIWSQELARELKTDQVVLAVNPGSLLASKMVKEGFGLAGNDIGIGAEILVKASLSDKFAESSGRYFDNDSKTFSVPHVDAANSEKNKALMTILESFYTQFG